MGLPLFLLRFTSHHWIETKRTFSQRHCFCSSYQSNNIKKKKWFENEWRHEYEGGFCWCLLEKRKICAAVVTTSLMSLCDATGKKGDEDWDLGVARCTQHYCWCTQHFLKMPKLPLCFLCICDACVWGWSVNLMDQVDPYVDIKHIRINLICKKLTDQVDLYAFYRST